MLQHFVSIAYEIWDYVLLAAELYTQSNIMNLKEKMESFVA
jgi:hypothetical protein